MSFSNNPNINSIVFSYNNIAIKKILDKNIHENTAYTIEINFLKIFKNALSIELEPKAENLSNLMSELYISQKIREIQLKSQFTNTGIKIEISELNTELITKILNMELNNLKKDFLDVYLPDNKINFEKLKANEISTKPKISIAEFYNQLNKVFDLAINKAANHTGCQIIDPEFKLQYRDSVSQKLQTIPLTDNLNCIRHAFYESREKKLENWIFKDTSLNPFSDSKKITGDVLLKNMHELGYKLAGDTQPNDLIFYVDGNGQFQHMGIMFDAHTVHSKWGSLKQVVSHPINHSPKMYKNYLLIFRKESSENSREWTLDSTQFQVKQ